MTPTQLEHLKRIDAHLERLLAIAEKRTPGEWKVCNGKHGTIIRLAKSTVGEPMDVCRAWNCSHKDGNAAFIASCAGNAEAGWRATRAAIACLLVICDPASGADFTNYGGETFLPQILAAFPLETLNPQKP